MCCSFKRQKKVLPSLIHFKKKKLGESGHKPNKTSVDKDSEFYTKQMKSWLQDKEIQIYSTNNERNSILAWKGYNNLEKKINKYMIAISKMHILIY